MISYVEGIQNALEFIEKNLTEDIAVDDIAGKAYMSAFHFQRVFSALCGVSVGEYLRLRRLTLAAEELAASDIKVIDAAIKYGYDSAGSFSRAFTKFHGVSPSAAKEKGAKLKSFMPLHISITLKGGNTMNYRIERKECFSVVGKARRFNAETSYDEIPKFWDEHLADPKNMKQLGYFGGMFGICDDSDGKTFDYLIADPYIPCMPVTEGHAVRVFEAGEWAVFPCTLKNLQDTNTRIWSEWLPNCREYKLSGNYNVEAYLTKEENPLDSRCEIWVPVEKI